MIIGQSIPFNLRDPEVLVALMIVAVLPLILFLLIRRLILKPKKILEITLDKDRLYLPRTLYLTIKNTGKEPVDINRPLLVFSQFFIRRKLKVKGSEGHLYYPLFLDPGMSHELSIDMNSFFQYDSSLKKYSRITVHISDVKGQISASKSIAVRKSLFR
jgi:hypothetical protein